MFKGNSKRRNIVIVVAVLLMVCCLGSIAVSAMMPDTIETVEPAATVSKTIVVPVEDSAIEPVPVEEAEELPTLAPTAKPLATEKPTRTPRPRPTATDTFTLDQRDMDYADDAIYVFDLLEDSSFIMVSYLTTVAGEPSLMFDEDWKTGIGMILATQLLAAEDIRDMKPGELTRPLHSEMLLMADDIETYVYLIAEAIDNQDSSKLTSAVTHIESAGTHASNVSARMAAITEGLQ